MARSLDEIRTTVPVSERFDELVAIGTPMWEVPKRMGMTAEAIAQALRREGVAAPPELHELVKEERQRRYYSR